MDCSGPPRRFTKLPTACGVITWCHTCVAAARACGAPSGGAIGAREPCAPGGPYPRPRVAPPPTVCAGADGAGSGGGAAGGEVRVAHNSASPRVHSFRHSVLAERARSLRSGPPCEGGPAARGARRDHNRHGGHPSGQCRDGAPVEDPARGQRGAAPHAGCVDRGEGHGVWWRVVRMCAIRWPVSSSHSR